ncbi:unnamed protein product [Rotaria magnacalcarata]|uniref:Uncharacterized protein n=1 Tax=Rotaria magnacalcarata TaxID=392030 RepID=A0A820JJ20_9BILA|nr:unnamed protein product [Rotaria magnacalcarata]CAF3999736.1 unnamed protein product [Rotaria magnacalcarata]CAF4078029.1 unnamed protein product [Rotaria magnacalcarata]CAF4326886.1 unnamed protein product [Rotaria magnacalcarata]
MFLEYAGQRDFPWHPKGIDGIWAYPNPDIFAGSANLIYTDYLKTFYPNQEENVFTCNNWILSDELIQIFESNVFYTQHVKSNVHRYRPFDVLIEEFDTQNELQSSLTQVQGCQTS